MKTWTYNHLTYDVIDETKYYLIIRFNDENYIIRRTPMSKPLQVINNTYEYHGVMEDRELISKLKPGQKFRFDKHGTLYIKVASDKNEAIHAASYKLFECKDAYVYLEN